MAWQEDSIRDMVGAQSFKRGLENQFSILEEIESHNQLKLKSNHHQADRAEYWDVVYRYLYNLNFQINQAFFISSYALFDGFLYKLARLLQDNTPKKIKLNDLKANTNLDKYILFFEAVYNFKSVKDKRDVLKNLKETMRISEMPLCIEITS